MGTRGAIGFRRHETDKVTYNHFDSYPSWLGMSMLKSLAGSDVEQCNETYERIVLVNEDDPPTAEDIERYAPHMNLSVSGQTPNEWYCLLRDLQGEITPYLDGSVDHMIDSHEFLGDSLFCEYAYIVNLDDETFEVYKGFNKDPAAPGRYAHLQDRDYRGVALIATVPLAEVFAATDEQRSDWTEAWEATDREEEDD